MLYIYIYQCLPSTNNHCMTYKDNRMNRSHINRDGWLKYTTTKERLEKETHNLFISEINSYNEVLWTSWNHYRYNILQGEVPGQIGLILLLLERRKKRESDFLPCQRLPIWILKVNTNWSQDTCLSKVLIIITHKFILGRILTLLL